MTNINSKKLGKESSNCVYFWSHDNLSLDLMNNVSFLSGEATPAALREKLKVAMKMKDKSGFEKALNECISAGIPELDADIQKAREAFALHSNMFRG